MTDLALVELFQGRADDALKRLEEGIRTCPTYRPAFHNTLATLLQQGRLRGGQLEEIQRHIIRHWKEAEWVPEYRAILNMPTFLNIEFVRGKCNLRCRMCQGTQNATSPRVLSYLEPDRFRQILDCAPTIHGITLSSGDSDPLLHPHIDEIIEVARDRNVMIDFYTNGHALTPKTARLIVDSQVVSMVNFSLDAATAETYRRIRGADFSRAVGKLEMLGSMKREADAKLPSVACSFVAMEDNIHELPDYARMVIERGAVRVTVGDLIGWMKDEDGGNRPATDHPDCGRYLSEAQAITRDAGVVFSVSDRLLASMRSDVEGPSDACESDSAAHASSGRKLACCGWINGVWVHMDGRYSPCCTVCHVADMGSATEGPLLGNEKFLRVKDLLRSGRVFERCLQQRGCEYIAQQRAAGKEIGVITREELGPLWRDPAEETVALAAP